MVTADDDLYLLLLAATDSTIDDPAVIGNPPLPPTGEITAERFVCHAL